MGKLLTNIRSLHGILKSDVNIKKGSEISSLNSIDNAWLLIEGENIVDFGEMTEVPEISNHEIIDLSGKMVLPAFCDSHTHLVFAGPRDKEF